MAESVQALTLPSWFQRMPWEVHAVWPLLAGWEAGLHWLVRFLLSLREGRLRRRYQRFLAEVELAGGVVLAHVPNSGRLTDVALPGRRCFLAPTQGSSLPFRVELVDAEGCLVGINTWRAAPLAEEALTAGLVDLPGLQRPFSIRREVAPLPGSRLDLLLEDGQGPYWVEVKNITWVVDGVALFPDAVTQRGAKHLRLLAELAAQGERTAVIYVVQRGDSQKVQAAASVDPAYARAVWDAAQAGVEFLAFDVAVSPRELRPRRALPVAVEAPA